MVGIGGFTGALIALSLLLKVNMQYYIIASVLVSGIIGYARLSLQAHSPKQIYIGWFTGLLVSFIILFVF
jgi:membrane-associated phospholipid phosphatase